MEDPEIMDNECWSRRWGIHAGWCSSSISHEIASSKSEVTQPQNITEQSELPHGKGGTRQSPIRSPVPKDALLAPPKTRKRCDKEKRRFKGLLDDHPLSEQQSNFLIPAIVLQRPNDPKPTSIILASWLYDKEPLGRVTSRVILPMHKVGHDLDRQDPNLQPTFPSTSSSKQLHVHGDVDKLEGLIQHWIDNLEEDHGREKHRQQRLNEIRDRLANDGDSKCSQIFPVDGETLWAKISELLSQLTTLNELLLDSSRGAPLNNKVREYSRLFDNARRSWANISRATHH